MDALYRLSYAGLIPKQNGAGDGNRTHIISLEGWSSTTELHPQISTHIYKWWRGEDSNLRRLSRQIYSLIPLATREPLHETGHCPDIFDCCQH